MLDRVFPGLLVVALGLFGAACGESDDGRESEPALSEETIASFEGLYELESFNESPSGCDGEGASTFDAMTERRFVLVGASFYGQPYLALASCGDVPECGERVSAIREGSSYAPEYHLILSAEVDPDTLTGFMASTGWEMDGVCVEREYADHELVREGDVVRVASRTKLLADAPVEDGYCVVRPARQKDEAAARECSSLTAFTGRRSGPLP